MGGYDIGNQDFTNLNGTLIDPEGKNVISILLWTTGHADDWDADDRCIVFDPILITML